MQFEADTYEKMLRAVQRKRGATVADLEERCEVSRPTIYRWIRRARNEGHDIIKRGSGGETTYSINNGEMDHGS